MKAWIEEFFGEQAKFGVWRKYPNMIKLLAWLVEHGDYLEWGLRNTGLPSIQVIVVDLEAKMDELGITPSQVGEERFSHFKQMLGSFIKHLLEKRGSFIWSKAGGRIKNSRYFSTSSYYKAANL